MNLSVEHITIARQGRPLVEDVAFTLSPGEALVLRGPNGVGKTTFLRTLAGFVRPASGTATFGEDRLDDPDGLQEHLVYAGHLDGIKAQLTVAENLSFWARLSGSDAIDAALEAFDLDALTDRLTAMCSAGQKRRLGLARLMVARRPVWLLDEPTVSLDGESRERLGKVVAAHLAAGGMALIATHDPDFLETPRTLTLERTRRDRTAATADPFTTGDLI